MIDHVGFAVSDYERAKEFYAKALAPLGYTLVMEMDGAVLPSGHPAIRPRASAGTASRISGSAAKAGSKSRCMWRS